MWPLAEAARHHGIDLYANRNYRALFDAPIGLSLPDGSAPGFNDNPGGSLKDWTDVYELAFTRWHRDPYGRVLQLAPRDSLTALLYGREVIPAGDVIPKTSVLLRDAGFAVLRTPCVSVAVRFGKHGGGHGHPDMLDIVTYADGQLFGLDPGSINYSVPLHKEWYRSSVAHNTVSVDQQLQSNANGQFLGCSSHVDDTRLAAIASVYPGVTFRRTLHLHGSMLNDDFLCESASEHVYDWLFHAPGAFSLSLPLTARTGLIAPTASYQHITQVGEGHTDTDFVATWRNPTASLSLHVAGSPGTVIFTGASAPAEIPSISSRSCLSAAAPPSLASASYTAIPGLLPADRFLPPRAVP